MKSYLPSLFFWCFYVSVGALLAIFLLCYGIMINCVFIPISYFVLWLGIPTLKAYIQEKEQINNLLKNKDGIYYKIEKELSKKKSI